MVVQHSANGVRKRLGALLNVLAVLSIFLSPVTVAADQRSVAPPRAGAQATPILPSPPVPSQATISPQAGGRLVSNDGRVQVDFAPRAVDKEVEVSHQPLAARWTCRPTATSFTNSS